MFKKIELWIVGLIILFFIILIILISGVLRDEFLGKNRTPEILRKNLLFISEIPKNIHNLIIHYTYRDINSLSILQKHKDKKKFEKFISKKRNAILILPRYDHNKGRSIVEIIDLNNFKVLHTYSHDIDKMHDQVKNVQLFPKIRIDHSEVRFIYQHPLILEDGSLMSINEVSFMIDFCSNLKWVNDSQAFHHSQEIDHEGNIWTGGQLKPKSKYVQEYKYKEGYTLNNFEDHSITKITKDGKILLNKSVTEILIENNLVDENIFSSGHDPIHLNDIEPALSDTTFWKKGDLFLSSRGQSAIIHYRPSNNKVINYIKGPFARQHDVDIISDKEISIFNNNNFFNDNEYSEILIYNYETKQFKKLFNNQLKKNNFKTITQGLSHTFKDGSLMVEEQNHGRLILFNKNGEKEWEFVNKDENGDIGLISWSRVIENELVIEKIKSLVENEKCLN